MEVAFFFGYRKKFYEEIMVDVEDNIKKFKGSKNKKTEWTKARWLAYLRYEFTLIWAWTVDFHGWNFGCKQTTLGWLDVYYHFM